MEHNPYFKDMDNKIAFLTGCQPKSMMLDGKIGICLNVFPSRLDKNKMISSEKWAVTLIDRGRSKLDPFSWWGHAVKNDGEYFTKEIELVANREDQTRAKILISKENHQMKETALQNSKSKTWVKNKHLIEKMLDEAIY